jgi:crotonobetainyl-CoA:carnitine CoA-transferase CaiB-like acyl-CoA transferase
MEFSGALSGIKVIDLSRLLPGPYCSMILADHGAEVIHVGNIDCRSDKYHIGGLDRNKKHITINLKSPEGREILLKLAETADVIIEGFRPGTVDKLQINYDALKKVNPRIIYCSITGYGQTGPFRNKAGHDVNYMSISGLLDQIGPKLDSPTIPGIQFADMAGGGMNGAIGILLALLAREKTGKGQHVDISMTDAMVGFLPIALFLKQLNGTFPKRSANLLSHRYACYNIYETADHHYISVGALEPHFWDTLCQYLKLPEYVPIQFDGAHQEEIINTFREQFLKKTRSQWEEALSPLDVCCEPVLTIDEVIKLPHHQEREMVIERNGTQWCESITLGVPVKLSLTPGGIRTPPVRLGENTYGILRELGYSELSIKTFSDKGVIECL